MSRPVPLKLESVAGWAGYSTRTTPRPAKQRRSTAPAKVRHTSSRKRPR